MANDKGTFGMKLGFFRIYDTDEQEWAIVWLQTQLNSHFFRNNNLNL